jgi:NAD(P)-dependent dehydrogenase (short-subunit alcohol dehydrogenase family)
MVNLSGKTALFTGASRGIGRASALALAQGGAQVLVHYGRGKVEAEAVVAEIRNAGGLAEVVASDLAAPDGAHKRATLPPHALRLRPNFQRLLIIRHVFMSCAPLNDQPANTYATGI